MKKYALKTGRDYQFIGDTLQIEKAEPVSEFMQRFGRSETLHELTRDGLAALGVRAYANDFVRVKRDNADVTFWCADRSLYANETKLLEFTGHMDWEANLHISNNPVTAVYKPSGMQNILYIRLLLRLWFMREGYKLHSVHICMDTDGNIADIMVNTKEKVAICVDGNETLKEQIYEYLQADDVMVKLLNNELSLM